ncbi:peptidylprolyl isomerase [Bacillus sp. FDAARGOS_1420]|uniref:peptidylprolyl isomerase n=1 Tax=Bacillus sp. FDAARGOS_1420 TaxID=2856338 RepID=UPI001C5AE90A|nr:peptidylprolyl isomerase [Bacillus sp. FDAARGOS_1420]MBW3496914.1 peptidylprolyl isomerase [Bacillus sp. FDAARGOS_1420]
MKKRQLFLGTITSGILILAACGNSNNMVTSKAGDISKSEFEAALKEQAGKPILKQIMKEKLILNKYKVSDSEVMDRIKEIKKETGNNFQVYLSRNGVKKEDELNGRLKPQIAFEKAVKKSITEEEIKNYYKPKIKASHILVKDAQVAKEIKEKLNNGEDFATLARQYSEDVDSKEKGGEISESAFIEKTPEFKETTYKLDAGQISEPVKSPSGYHIIKVTEKEELKPFDQEKENIRKELELIRLQNPKWEQKFFEELIKETDLKILDKDLKDTFKDVKL